MIKSIRKYISRKLMFWSFLGLVLIFYNLDLNRGMIARIKIEGSLESNLELTDKLTEIEKDPKIKALIVYINSPGGTAVAGEEIYTSLRKISKNKPVVSILGDIATSAGYMAALGTDYVIAREGTLTGNIGVLMQHFDVGDILQKLGVKVSTLTSGSFKAIGSPYNRLNKQATNLLLSNIDKLAKSFINITQTRRHLTAEQVKIISDGRPLLGSEALGLQLVDQIGGMPEALNWIELHLESNVSYPVTDIEFGTQNFAGWIKKYL